MTPQDLSIADLKAVIDFISKKIIHSKNDIAVYGACKDELHKRILALHPPTEPKNEERK